MFSPFLCSCHRQRESLFSSGSGYHNYRGLLNDCILLLVCVCLCGGGMGDGYVSTVCVPSTIQLSQWKCSRNSARCSVITAVIRWYCACLARILTWLHAIVHTATSVMGLCHDDYMV